MTAQPAHETPRSLWRVQATRWLGLPQPDFPDSEIPPAEFAIGAIGAANDDQDPDPPPAAPAMRPWPRIFPAL